MLSLVLTNGPLLTEKSQTGKSYFSNFFSCKNVYLAKISPCFTGIFCVPCCGDV